MKKHRTATVLSLAIAGSVLTGCVLPPTQAELKTYESIGPAHRAYVLADPSMSEPDKALKLDVIESWRKRVGGK